MRTYLIAIVGGSGSGKTWLAERLLELFGADAGRLSLDDFYRDLSGLPLAERRRVNFDHPCTIDWPLFTRTIKAIGQGRPAELPQYDFKTHTRRRRTKPWKPCRLVILDGLWLLRRAELRRLYSLSVFVECPECLRLLRRIERDQHERGRSADSVRAQFVQQVLPMHHRFVASQAREAGLVIDGGASRRGLSDLSKRCRQLLQQE